MIDIHITGPTAAEVWAAFVDFLSRLAIAIASRWPPWWMWVIFIVSLFTFGLLARKGSLRALQVVPPADVERTRAAAAGREIAARGLIGLVLGGGGAKGAYQVGCWKALRECGIVRFGAIAGTSVGALNAILVAQDEFDHAERIWNDMSFGRVLRMRWYLPIAVAIRLVLIVPYLGKFAFPARAIPIGLYRAVHQWQKAWRNVEPQLALLAALRLYLDLAKADMRSSRWVELLRYIPLGLIFLGGLSAWWIIGAPVFELVALFILAPIVVLLIVNYASLLVTSLDLLATRLVLASNDPLDKLIRECVDPVRLKAYPQPVFVTLGALREVTRSLQPQSPGQVAAAVVQKPPIPPMVTMELDKDFGTSLDNEPLPIVVTTVEYVPRHFKLNAELPGRMFELILQSAGLPEIFPAREFDGVTYVDGGIADNEPLAALAGLQGQNAIIVIPLNMQGNEAKIRTDLKAVLERLGQPLPIALPELIVLTPSRSLGNMLTGTMDFAAARARAMIRLGYCDTIRQLARRGCTSSS